jgi:N-acetylglucosaminyl-diphospho-decaprenol L-rhamnosyltransferase
VNDLELDVVIVSYRCRELVHACLRSLEEHLPTVPTNVWVVDNASGDGTVETVRDEFPAVSVVALERNVGFAVATNMAIRTGRGRYVLVLNPDTELRPKTLDTLVELLERRRDVGIAGCRLERRDGSFDHASRRSFPTVVGALGHFSGIGRHLGNGSLAQYRAPEVEFGPVDAVNGAFMLIRRQALEEVGLFDEAYWMYMEDLDLCYRFSQAGWITWYEPLVTALHVKHGTAPRRTPRLAFAFHAGMWRFYRKHYAQGRPHALNGAVLGGIVLRLAGSVAAAAVSHAFDHSLRNIGRGSEC